MYAATALVLQVFLATQSIDFIPAWCNAVGSLTTINDEQSRIWPFPGVQSS